jgi:hypothetical protein
VVGPIRRLMLAAAAAVAVAAIASSRSSAHEVNVHQAITAEALAYLVEQHPELAACNTGQIPAVFHQAVEDEDEPVGVEFIGPFLFHFFPHLDDTVNNVLSTRASSSCSSPTWGLVEDEQKRCWSDVPIVGNILLHNPHTFDAEAVDLLRALPNQPQKRMGLVKLGHLLHLLQDLTSPAHASNDAHPPIANPVLDMLGDPSTFEVFNSWHPTVTGPFPAMPAITSEFDAMNQLQTFVSSTFLSEKAALALDPQTTPPNNGRYLYEGSRPKAYLGPQGRYIIDRRVARAQFSELAPLAVAYTAALIKWVHENRGPVCEQRVETRVSGPGRITSSPDGFRPADADRISCRGGSSDRCAHFFPSGQQVTLTVSSDSAHDFIGWGGACSGTGPCTLEMDGVDPKFVTAHFSDPVAGVYDAVAVAGVPLPRDFGTLHRIHSGQMRFNDHDEFSQQTTGFDGIAFGGFTGERRLPPDPAWHPFGWAENFSYRVGDVSDVPVVVFPGGNDVLPPGRIIYGRFGATLFPLASLASDERTLTMYSSALDSVATFVRRPPVRVMNLTPPGRALSFPNTVQGVVSAHQTIALENAGPEPIRIEGLRIVDADFFDPDFVLSGASGACDSSIQFVGDILAPGEVCSLDIAFAPRLTYTTGPRTAGLTFRTNAGSTSGSVLRDITFALEGTATGVPTLGPLPPGLSFPETPSATVSAPQLVSVLNTGTVPLALGVPSTTAGSFRVDSTGCRNRSLPPGASCSIAVSYGPFGQFAGTLAIPTNTGSTTGSRFTSALVPLTAANAKPLADVVADVTTIRTGRRVSLDGFPSSDLEAQPLTYAWRMTSIPFGSNVALETSSTVFTHFTPDVPGPYVIELVVNDGVLDSDPARIVITAVPPPPVLQLSQTALTFPATPVGERSAAQTITVTNVGGSTATITSASFAGDFGVSSNSCSTLVVQESCAIDVFFAPTVAGPRLGQLTLVSDAENSPSHVIFSGAPDLDPFAPPRVVGIGHIAVAGNWTLRFFAGDDDESSWLRLGSHPEFEWEEDETPGLVVPVNFGITEDIIRIAEEENAEGLRPITIEALPNGSYLVHLHDDDPPNEVEVTLLLQRAP